MLQLLTIIYIQDNEFYNRSIFILRNSQYHLVSIELWQNISTGKINSCQRLYE